MNRRQILLSVAACGSCAVGAYEVSAAVPVGEYFRKKKPIPKIRIESVGVVNRDDQRIR